MNKIFTISSLTIKGMIYIKTSIKISTSTNSVKMVSFNVHYSTGIYIDSLEFEHLKGMQKKKLLYYTEIININCMSLSIK